MRPKNQDLQKSLDGMIDRTKKIEGYLNRVVYPEYQNLQRARWMSENASEGNLWIGLEPNYARRKKTLFADYPGAGTKILIATGRLVKGVVGPSPDHRKMVSGSKLTVGWNVVTKDGFDYAAENDKTRPFSEFSDYTNRRLYNNAAKWMMTARLK